MENKVCPACNEIFFRKPSEMKRCKVCSLKCRKQLTRSLRKTKCRTCDKIFYPEKRTSRKDPQFCSQECMGSSYAFLDYRISFLKDSIDFLDGFLLGDGHISKKNCHVSWSLRYPEFSTFIEKKLSSYVPKSSTRFVKDSRLKNGGTFSTRGNTKCHPDFKRQRERWYPKGKKIVPKNVSLSPESVLIWYLGDGGLAKYSASLCTDDFSEQDVRYLVKKLNECGVRCYKRNNNRNHPRIIIPSSGLDNFFDYIGNKSPVRCYDHKFAHRDRGYKTSEKDMSKPQ